MKTKNVLRLFFFFPTVVSNEVDGTYRVALARTGEQEVIGVHAYDIEPESDDGKQKLANIFKLHLDDLVVCDELVEHYNSAKGDIRW